MIFCTTRWFTIVQLSVPGTIVLLYMTAQIVQIFTNCAILGQIVRLCIIIIFCSLAVILIVCKMQNVASGVKMLAIINSIDIKTGGQFHKLHFLSFANVVARRVGYIRYIKPASISFNFQNSIMSGLRNNYITRPAADIPQQCAKPSLVWVKISGALVSQEDFPIIYWDTPNRQLHKF